MELLGGLKGLKPPTSEHSCAFLQQCTARVLKSWGADVYLSCLFAGFFYHLLDGNLYHQLAEQIYQGWTKVCPHGYKHLSIPTINHQLPGTFGFACPSPMLQGFQHLCCCGSSPSIWGAGKAVDGMIHLAGHHSEHDEFVPMGKLVSQRLANFLHRLMMTHGGFFVYILDFILV